VDSALETLKTELERFGETNDAATKERSRRMLNITRDTGDFLGVLVRATAARRVLEIGTSNGYSTLWLADAARAIDGSVTTVEFAEYKVELASNNFTRSGLSPFISLIILVASALLILVDFNYVRKHATEDDVVWLATGIFVSIINIFLSLLSLFGNR